MAWGATLPKKHHFIPLRLTLNLNYTELIEIYLGRSLANNHSVAIQLLYLKHMHIVHAPIRLAERRSRLSSTFDDENEIDSSDSGSPTMETIQVVRFIRKSHPDRHANVTHRLLGKQ